MVFDSEFELSATILLLPLPHPHPLIPQLPGPRGSYVGSSRGRKKTREGKFLFRVAGRRAVWREDEV